MVSGWTEATTAGYVFNRYVKIQCFYPKLLSHRGFNDRLKFNYLSPALPLVRFFNINKKSTESHSDFEQFIEDIKLLPHYRFV
jgi:hypothetical protein